MVRASKGGVGSVLCGQGLQGFQQVQGQAVLGVVLWEHLNQAGNQPFGLTQRDRGTPEVTGVLP